ncbi:polysaccharide deacetylase family protein [Streptomyces sp. NPDC052207]|uniref:polysaccharide deacetylase family protein n=1 Tax=Streptomyces sp. NPDC052207 TaxID=3155418 RepID=UPI0034375AF4
MARHLFGLTPADVTFSQSGTSVVLEPGASGTAWDARVGGTQITDLTDLDGNPIIEVTSDTYSTIAFYGPDGITNLYLDFGFAGGRTLMQATDLGASITDLQTNKLDISADLRSGGTITGDLAVSGRLSGPVGPYGVIAPSRNTPAWRPALISHQFQSGHGWTAQGAASSNLNNTAAFVRGTQCASITTDTAGGSANLRKFGNPTMDLTDKAIRLICRADDVSKIGHLNFFVGNSSLANNFKWRLWEISATTQLGSNNEWVTLTFGWSSLNSASGSYSISSTGVPSTTSGFTDFQVQAIGTTGNAYTLDVQAVEVIDATTTTFPNGVISIVFDDGADSIFNYARPAMDSYGFQGTNYVIVSNLGTTGVMTSAQNKVLQDFSGWEVGLHSYDGTVHNNRYTAYTAAQVDDDIRLGKQWLVQNGFRGESIAYPGGEYQKTTDGVGIDSIANRYFSTGRTILFQSGYPTETFPAGMPMRVRAVSSISSTQVGANNPTSLVAAGGLLDKCQLNGGWLILTFHKITTGAATVSTECSQADFQMIMAAIASRGIPVVPVADVNRLYS